MPSARSPSSARRTARCLDHPAMTRGIPAFSAPGGAARPSCLTGCPAVTPSAGEATMTTLLEGFGTPQHPRRPADPVSSTEDDRRLEPDHALHADQAG